VKSEELKMKRIVGLVEENFNSPELVIKLDFIITVILS
jgi:hypothetical protein